MQDKFKDGTVWRMTKVALANEQSQCIGSPLKICIDLRNTQCVGILQGFAEMVPAPAPQDELKCMLALERTQRVDLTALITDISPARRETTAYGQKHIVDVTFVDGSKPAGRQDQVKAQMAMFCETSANGAAELKSLRDVHASNTVVALYGLTCIPRGGGLCEFKASSSLVWEVAPGIHAKLARLQA